MATVDRLLIKGIRSFSPEHGGVITFPKPLTLIVGRNGSGKTTIIECLKHAVTGEWPPNSHAGKSFIHDPKVSGDIEVKGQIKLQCKTVAGKPFVVVRSFQLTQKKGGKYEFKALDQTISTVNEEGKREALSKKCADINLEVPALMGVSKAILENVIFVHQDDSNWPLAEGAVLKKKFDDIFAATKYTKALETIRKMKTDQAQGIREKKLSLEALRAHKESAHKLRMDLEDAEKSHAHNLKRMNELEHEILQLQKEADGIEGKLKKMTEIISTLRLMEAQHETLVAENMRRFEALPSEVEGPLATLEGLQRQFDESSKSKIQAKRAAEKSHSDQSIRLEQLKAVLATAVAAQGRLAAEVELQAKRMRDRQAEVAELAKRQPAIGMHFAGLPTETQVAEFGIKAHARQTALQQEYTDLKAANAERLKSCTRTVDKATEAAAAATESVRLKKLELRRMEARGEENTRELADAPATERSLAEDEERLAAEVAKLEKRRGDTAALKFDDKIKELNATIQAQKHELIEAKRERDGLSSMAGIAGQAQLLERDAAEKNEAVKAAFAQCTPQLQELFGEQVPRPETLKASLATLMATSQQAATAADTSLRKQRDAVAALDARVVDANSALVRLKEEVKAKRDEIVARVLDGGEMDSFQALLAEKEQDVQEKKGEVANVTALINVIQRSIAHADDHKECMLCLRPFADAKETADFVAVQRQSVQVDLPGARAVHETGLTEATAAIAALVRARPLWEECQRMKERDIPKATEVHKGLSEQQGRAQAELQTLEAKAAELQARVRQAAALASTADTLERLGREAAALLRRAADQRQQMAHLSGGAAGKTLDDVIAEVLDAEGKLDEAESARDKFVDRRKNAADEIVLLERNVTSVREAVARTKARGERVVTLERERAEMAAQKQHLEVEIADDERRQSSSRKEKADAEAVRDRMRDEHAAREQELDQGVRALLRDLDRVTDQTNAIKAFMDERKSEQLLSAKSAVADAQERVNEGEAALKQLADSVRTLDEEVRSFDSNKRLLDDNVAYRQGLAAAEALEGQMQELGAQRDALGDYTPLRRQSEKLRNKAQEFRNDQNVSRGCTSTYKESIDKCRRELKDASFKDVDERFRHATIELRTTEMANDDLNKYYNALDKALMAFHAAKMAEINKVIKELWQKTYRNQDIDHIFISSDAEATTGRSYNYRVVMKNGDAELDMRGRCSAGQRVLACLIIRLALAETFCLNCGILALDEPTTNLDARNSTSLAQALTDLMQSRRDQENFQLIVITHDVRFAHLIGQREHAEYYWRISKDEEMHSHIEKEDILDG